MNIYAYKQHYLFICVVVAEMGIVKHHFCSPVFPHIDYEGCSEIIEKTQVFPFISDEYK